MVWEAELEEMSQPNEAPLINTRLTRSLQEPLQETEAMGRTIPEATGHSHNVEERREGRVLRETMRDKAGDEHFRQHGQAHVKNIGRDDGIRDGSLDAGASVDRRMKAPPPPPPTSAPVLPQRSANRMAAAAAQHALGTGVLTTGKDSSHSKGLEGERAPTPTRELHPPAPIAPQQERLGITPDGVIQDVQAMRESVVMDDSGAQSGPTSTSQQEPKDNYDTTISRPVKERDFTQEISSHNDPYFTEGHTAYRSPFGTTSDRDEHTDVNRGGYANQVQNNRQSTAPPATSRTTEAGGERRDIRENTAPPAIGERSAERTTKTKEQERANQIQAEASNIPLPLPEPPRDTAPVQTGYPSDFSQTVPTKHSTTQPDTSTIITGFPSDFARAESAKYSTMQPGHQETYSTDPEEGCFHRSVALGGRSSSVLSSRSDTSNLRQYGLNSGAGGVYEITTFGGGTRAPVMGVEDEGDWYRDEPGRAGCHMVEGARVGRT